MKRRNFFKALAAIVAAPKVLAEIRPSIPPLQSANHAETFLTVEGPMNIKPITLETHDEDAWIGEAIMDEHGFDRAIVYHRRGKDMLENLSD